MLWEVIFPENIQLTVSAVGLNTLMLHWLLPKETLQDEEVHRGLRMLHMDAVFAQMMAAFTVGPFMIAFAVLLGAPNVVIGLLGAIGPLSQIIQIPAILLVERTGMRKALTIGTASVARSVWIAVASIPLWVPEAWRIYAFLGCLMVFFGLTAVTSCAFASWIRDVIPEEVMTSFFSKRMMFATAAGASVSLLAGMGVDAYHAWFGEALGAYSIIYGLGALAGFIGLHALGNIPEPKMTPPAVHGFRAALARPFQDLAFRNLTFFLGAWCFAANFSGPFFAVYMLRRMELNMTWLLGLTVLSQMMNIISFRIWGRIADRFNNKSVLNMAVPLYFFCLLLWPLMSSWGVQAAMVLVVVFHMLAGIATAGVALAANNMTLLRAPRGEATPYLAVSALIQGAAASIAPIIAGLAADTFDRHAVSIDFHWHYEDMHQPMDLMFSAIRIHGLDFIFLISFVFGLYAIHRLLAVHEEGEVSEAVVRREFFVEVERVARKVSTVAGLRLFTDIAFSRVAGITEEEGKERSDPLGLS